MTTLVVLQPGYLPWLGYFDQMNRADVFVHYDDVPFDKHGWRNRNRVKGPNGPTWLTIPVRHSGRFGQSICEVEIDSEQPWQRKHLTAIKQYYAKTPFVDLWLPKLAEIVDQRWLHLVDLDLTVIDLLSMTLGITTPTYRSSELGIGGDKNERLLSLCRYFKATRYLTGDAARDYLDVQRFEAEGIEVVWHNYKHPTYAQLYGEFVPYLSVIDLLMNVGPDALRILSNHPIEIDRGSG